MRLYAHQDRAGWDRIGALVDGELITGGQLEKHGATVNGLTWQSVCCLVNDTDWRRDLEGMVRRAVKAKGKARVKRIDPERRRPLPAVRHGKVVCVGLNYGDHVAEGGRPAPDRPTLFSKFPNAIIGDGESIVRPEGTHALDLEVELGVVIGRAARRVSEADAPAHIAGYVVANDVSARNWQGSPPALREGEHGDGQWLRAKGSDTFLPVGPTFVTADEVNPADGLAIRSWRIPGGDAEPVLMQDGNTSDLLFPVPMLISYISRHITLEPGDLVITGTPAGVGVFRDPPVFLEPGDRVRCEIEGIGVVENPVVDWTDDPRPPV